MFTAAFTAASTALGNLVITDISNYATEPKSGFISRLIYITYANGQPLTFFNSPDFSYAIYATDILTLPGITRDLSLRITMSVTSGSPQPGSIYTATQVVTGINFSSLFLYSLSQAIAANPAIMNIPFFYENLAKAYTLKNVANTAGYYSDQVAAQQALDTLNEMIQNQSNYFS